MEEDSESIKRQIEALQKELEQKRKSENKQRYLDHVEGRNTQSEEEKGSHGKYSLI